MTHARHAVARCRSSRSGFGKWRRGLVLSGLLPLLILGSGCEDDSDLGLVVKCLIFVAEAGPTDGEVVARRSADSSCDEVVVELIVTGVDDVHAASFKIDFPNQFSVISDNLDVSDSFLGDDLITFFAAVSSDSGIVVGGVTRQGPEKGVTPDDTNNILFKVAFRRLVDSGSGALSFDDANLEIRANPGDVPVLPDPPVPFRGGTLMIVDDVL